MKTKIQYRRCPIFSPPFFTPTGGAFDFFIEEAVRHGPRAGKPRGSKPVLSGMPQPQRWTASIIRQANNDN
jgi:hypothetical protein